MAITEIATIAEIPEGRPGNSIFVSLNDTGNGRMAVDVRRWYVGDDNEWRPTQKGISLPVQYLSTVIDALQTAIDREDVVEAIGSASKPVGPPVKKAAAVVEAAPKPSAAKSNGTAKKVAAKKVEAKKAAPRRTSRSSR